MMRYGDFIIPRALLAFAADNISRCNFCDSTHTVSRVIYYDILDARIAPLFSIRRVIFLLPFCSVVSSLALMLHTYPLI